MRSHVESTNLASGQQKVQLMKDGSFALNVWQIFLPWNQTELSLGFLITDTAADLLQNQIKASGHSMLFMLWDLRIPNIDKPTAQMTCRGYQLFAQSFSTEHHDANSGLSAIQTSSHALVC